MFGGGEYAIDHYTTTGSSLSSVGTGEFGHEIDLKSAELLTVESTYMPFYVISAHNLSSSTASTIHAYAISPIENTTVASIHIQGYDLSAGDYYLIAFNGSAPSITYSYIPLSLSYVSLVSGIGIFVLIIGIIIAIVGLVLRKKKVETLDQV